MFFFCKYKRGFLFMGIPLFLISCEGCSVFSRESSSPKEFTLMTYNVQNLFDGVNDGTEYSDLIIGEGNWSEELFHLKLLQLSDVLSLYPVGGADIVLLQEVENRNALDVLNTHYLKGAGYHHTVIGNGEGLAVNTAVLSRFPFHSVKVHSVSVEGERAGRPILECRIGVGDREIVVFNNHWKSKSGGARETEALRKAAAAVVSRRLWALYTEDPGLPVVVAGDLNENVDEWARVGEAYPTALRVLESGMDEFNFDVLYLHGSFSELRESEHFFLSVPVRPLFSPWLEGPDFPGSYAYRGEWETIDHVLLSSSFADDQGLEYQEFKVVHPDSLLNDDGYPLRWLPSTENGFSDHLPLLLTVEVSGG